MGVTGLDLMHQFFGARALDEGFEIVEPSRFDKSWPMKHQMGYRAGQEEFLTSSLVGEKIDLTGTHVPSDDMRKQYRVGIYFETSELHNLELMMESRDFCRRLKARQNDLQVRKRGRT